MLRLGRRSSAPYTVHLRPSDWTLHGCFWELCSARRCLLLRLRRFTRCLYFTCESVNSPSHFRRGQAAAQALPEGDACVSQTSVKEPLNRQPPHLPSTQ